MERQIEQLLKEVKGNETLERLVKMNRNPNELFIERIRTMNKGQNTNTQNIQDILKNQYVIVNKNIEECIKKIKSEQE